MWTRLALIEILLLALAQSQTVIRSAYQKHLLCESDKFTFPCSIPFEQDHCLLLFIQWTRSLARQIRQERTGRVYLRIIILQLLFLQNFSQYNVISTLWSTKTANLALNKPCLPISWMDLRMEDCCSKFQKRSAFRKTENNEFTIFAFRLNLFCTD